MSRKKRVICLLVAMVMCVVCVAGCSCSNNSSDGAAESNNTSNTSTKKNSYTLKEYIDSKDIVIIYESTMEDFAKDKKPKNLAVFKDGQVFYGGTDKTWAELASMTDKQICDEVTSRDYSSRYKDLKEGEEDSIGKWTNYTIFVDTDKTGGITEREYILINQKKIFTHYETGSNGQAIQANRIVCMIPSVGLAYNPTNGIIMDEKYISCIEAEFDWGGYGKHKFKTKPEYDTYYYIREDENVIIKPDEPHAKGITTDPERPFAIDISTEKSN